MKKYVMSYTQIPDRILLNWKGKPFNIAIVVVYAPSAENTEEEIDRFYNSLGNAKTLCKFQEFTIIVRDLGTKLWNEREVEIVGKFGLGSRNERGEKWIQWCTNIWLQEHAKDLCTWRSQGGDKKKHIDYVTINKYFRIWEK